MYKAVKQLLLSSLLVLLVACSTPSGETANPHLWKVTYNRDQLVLDDLRVHRSKGGVLIVDANWRSRMPSGTPFQYRVQWLDNAGGPLSSADRGMRSVTLMHGPNTMRFVAKNTESMDFRIYIELRKN